MRRPVVGEREQIQQVLRLNMLASRNDSLRVQRSLIGPLHVPSPVLRSTGRTPATSQAFSERTRQPYCVLKLTDQLLIGG